MTPDEKLRLECLRLALAYSHGNVERAVEDAETLYNFIRYKSQAAL